MTMQVRRAANAGPVRVEHWFVASLALTLALAAAWAALVMAGEVCALVVDHAPAALRDPSTPLVALLHPSTPTLDWGSGRTAAGAMVPLFWTIAGVTFGALLVPSAWLVVRIGRWVLPDDGIKGQATRAQLARLTDAGAVCRIGFRLRPSLADSALAPSEVGIRIGDSARDSTPVWMSLQNNLGLVAGPQTGKTTSTMGVIPLTFPGPAIMTETHRPDVLAMSGCQPDFDRPVLVLDPENRVGWPDPIGVDILAGCEDHAVAHRRASLLVRAAAARSETVSSNMEFFLGEATTAATAFLHAARLSDEATLSDVLRWTQCWGTDQPIEILEAHRTNDAARSDAQMLRQLYSVTGPQAAGTAGELRNAFGCLAHPNVARTFGGAGSAFDVGRFLDERARLYVHGSGREQRSIAPFVALVISEIVDEALARAATAPGRRLDPPLLLDLDEVANIAPLPELPYYLSAGAGSGICTAWAAQGRAQLRKRWGADAAREIWQSTNFRVWFGGSVEADDLRELQDLSGEVWEETVSEQRPEWAEWLLSSRSWDRYGKHRGVQRVPVFTADQLRTLRDGRAVLLARNLPIAELVMRPWWERRDIAGLVRESIRTFDATVSRRPSA